MKILNYKNTAIALIALFTLSTLGCKKFLDTQRQGEYAADNYPYPGGSGPYDTFIFGAYKDLRAYDVHVFGFILSTSVRSDDADKGSTASDGGADALTMDNFPVLASNGLVNGMWTGYYTFINKSNQVLKQIKENKEIVATDGQKIQAEAEARFLRGYAYFNMVRLFGKIPLINKVLPIDSLNVPQSTPAQIYAFIESDLQFAAANLPPSWDAAFAGRATSGAANGLLAKVYLTQKKWSAAMATANMVMTNGQYNLNTPYNDIFGEAGENSKESVFEVQATSSATERESNGVQSTQFQGVRDGGIWDLGFGFNVPNSNLEAAYELNDPRKERTFLRRSTGSVTYKTVYGENTATTWENPVYNHKVLVNRSYISRYGFNSGYWMNLRILRYADVVLMYAEAANEVGGAGNTTLSLAALNSVRARARAGVAGTLPNVTTTIQADLRNAIKRERRVELAMEYDRFFDLVRWGDSQFALTSSGKTNFNATRDNLLPIPQAQIDLSKGLLTQNFGY